MIWRLCLIVILLTASAFPAQAASYDAFSRIPVQHEGRVKPMGSLARVSLSAISGHERINDLSADEWLAETLFDPSMAMRREIFRVLKPSSIGLSGDKKYFSYLEISALLAERRDTIEKLAAVPDKDWSEDQRELMRVQDAALLYAQLLRSFSMILPLNVTVPDALAKSWKFSADGPLTLRDIAPHRAELNSRIKKITKRKGDKVETYSPEEKSIADFAFQVEALQQGGNGNVLLRVFPPDDAGQAEWVSPWTATENAQKNDRLAIAITLWKHLAVSYLTGNETQWEDYAATLADLGKGAMAEPRTISWEIFYTSWHPLTVALLLYAGALLLLSAAVMTRKPRLRTGAVIAVAAGLTAHIGAIALRVLILSRPPVGTLYESIIFVAAICVAGGLLMEVRKRNNSGLLAAAFSGTFLLFMAQAFADGDTMGILVAVLNTNFWLATHVLCITAGYGFCLLASFLAHLWLAAEAKGRETDLAGSIKTVALIALFLTAIGTLLGGIWADQSWGRFWGWDPKENGALLIVLWLIWILHARIAGQIERSTFMAGIASLSIVVALAWFGVNLLSVGLHSYGFITGVATGLFAFCAAEAVLIFYLWHRGRKRAA